MGVEKYLVKIEPDGGGNLCWDCERACGDCPWSEIDPDTGHPRFAPVPGWTAKKVTRPTGNGPGGKAWMTTYSITSCPLFVQTPPRKSSPAMLTDAQNDWFLRKTKHGRFD